jgi:hypothetical protein
MDRLFGMRVELDDRMPRGVVAVVSPARFSDGSVLPGLLNVVTEDGRVFTDLTLGQLRSLASREDWQISASE